MLPPRAVDSAEELAQLSQFVINIVDFRDPDATMTHWLNPDVSLASGGTAPASPVPGPDSERRVPPNKAANATGTVSTSTAWSTTRSPSTR